MANKVVVKPNIAQCPVCGKVGVYTGTLDEELVSDRFKQIPGSNSFKLSEDVACEHCEADFTLHLKVEYVGTTITDYGIQACSTCKRFGKKDCEKYDEEDASYEREAGNDYEPVDEDEETCGEYRPKILPVT